jgi:hypothetical protein
MWTWQFGQLLLMLDPNHQLVKDKKLRDSSDATSIYEQLASATMSNSQFKDTNRVIAVANRVHLVT